MEFNKEELNDLVNFFKTPPTKNTKVSIKFNKEYFGVIKEALVIQNKSGDLVISLYITINVDNVYYDQKINKSFSEANRNNSRIYMLQVLDTLGYKYDYVAKYIAENSNNPLGALVNLYNTKKGSKIVYIKQGKPTSYQHIIKASQEVPTNG